MSRRHPTAVTIPAWYPGDIPVAPQELADKLGDLRYDALAEYLDALSAKLQNDSGSDGARGRGQLSTVLGRMSQELASAATSARAAWKICEPHVKEKG